MHPTFTIEQKQVTVTGRFFKIARLGAEGYEFVESPERAVEQLRTHKVGADIFTFTQQLAKSTPEFSFYREADSLAVLAIQNYDSWWKNQINDKTRNMVRKAAKKNVAIRVVEFDDELVSGIEDIHNESPIRQGKPFKHFGKPFDTVKNDHATFLDRSEFIGAYYEGELIGIVKLVHQGAWSNLMQIISKIAHRDKAPTNALLAKAVEICAAKGVPRLQYGIWSKGGIGDFKMHHGFERVEVPRYYIPLTFKGRIMLRLGLHRGALSMMPARVADCLLSLRSKWYYFKFRSQTANGTLPQLGEQHAKA